MPVENRKSILGTIHFPSIEETELLPCAITDRHSGEHELGCNIYLPRQMMAERHDPFPFAELQLRLFNCFGPRAAVSIRKGREPRTPSGLRCDDFRTLEGQYAATKYLVTGLVKTAI